MPLESLDRRLGQLARLGVGAGVHRERAAAARQARHLHVVALGGQHSRGRLVHVAEEDALHAALEQGHLAAPLAPRIEALRQPRQRAPRGGLRRHAHDGRELRREPAHARAARQSRKAEPVRQRGTGRERAHAAGAREQLEHEPAVGGVGGGPLEVSLHLGAGVLEQLVVLDPRRAGRDAGHAAEAVVEVLHERGGDLVVALFHQHDPPARRVHLLAPENVGGAGGQAEAAVNAVVDQVELRGSGVVPGGDQTSLPEGSKRSFTRSASSRAPGSTGPSRSTSSAAGRSSTAAVQRRRSASTSPR